jgi:Cd2+/Zn2+-exporting ATPase
MSNGKATPKNFKGKGDHMSTAEKVDRKQELLLENLGCANCAAKIEKKVGNLDGVKTASVNFVSKILQIEVLDSNDMNRILDEASVIAVDIESGIKVIRMKELEDGKIKAGTMKPVLKSEWLRYGLATLLFALGLVLQLDIWLELGIFVVAYLLFGADVLVIAVRNILKGNIFDENFLMSIATLGAFAIGEYPEAVAVMLFYKVGEFFQDHAVNRSRDSISALMNIRPEYANLKTGKTLKKVAPEKVQIGDEIVVKPGEKVPLDGFIVEGESSLNVSQLTGESLPKEVAVGSEILSGSINLNGTLTVRTSKTYEDSTVSKILELVQNAHSQKAPTEQFITKFARYYTPIVVFSALALAIIPPLVVPGAVFSEWLKRALIFLVVSCPCALVISIPLGFFGGIGAASKSGILIKGGNYLEALTNVTTVVFDKTGTLTKGKFAVQKIFSVIPLEEAKVLEHIAHAEYLSNHPIALSILEAYSKEINREDIAECEEVSGFGMKVTAKGQNIIAGNAKLLKQENIQFIESEDLGTQVYLAVNRVYLGYLVIADELKENAAEAVAELKKMNIGQLVMLTGDNRAIAEKTGLGLGLEEVYYELLPHQKVEKLELLEKNLKAKQNAMIVKSSGFMKLIGNNGGFMRQLGNKAGFMRQPGKLVFMGDGMNDAPVLARADIGIAMGGVGSDAAIEAADVVLMTDDPMNLIKAIRIAQRTKTIVWQNIVFALGVKALVLLMGAVGIATMWEAVFADVGVALIAVLNAMRVLEWKA